MHTVKSQISVLQEYLGSLPGLRDRGAGSGWTRARVTEVTPRATNETSSEWLTSLDNFRNWLQLGRRPAKGHENRWFGRMAALGAARSRLAMEQLRPSNCLTRSVRD